MTDFWNLAMLGCTCIAALGFGIFAAYFILRAGFALMRPRRREAAVKPSAEMARVS